MFFGEREFLMWIIIMLALGLTALASFVYLLTRFHNFTFIRALGDKSRVLSWLAALLPLLLTGVFWYRFNVTTLFVVLLHLMAAFLLCGLVILLIRKIGKCDISYNFEGAAAILLTV